MLPAASTAHAAVLAAVVNLDRPGHYLHWGVIQISLANLLVICVMLVTFAAALVLPFPKPGHRR